MRPCVGGEDVWRPDVRRVESLMSRGFRSARSDRSRRLCGRTSTTTILLPDPARTSCPPSPPQKPFLFLLNCCSSLVSDSPLVSPPAPRQTAVLFLSFRNAGTPRRLPCKYLFCRGEPRIADTQGALRFPTPGQLSRCASIRNNTDGRSPAAGV